jgi:hypothetical protein
MINEKGGAGLKPAPPPFLIRRVFGMKIGEGLKEWFHSIEKDPQKKLHLLAFRDFCFDLFEEEFGRVPQREETETKSVKGLLIPT